MTARPPGNNASDAPPAPGPYDGRDEGEDDLWFLPGPAEEEADPSAPFAHQPSEAALVADWAAAEAGLAAMLARVAGRLGALDDRLSRGPAGWRHRLALIEVAELGWLVGDRVTSDRLALWVALRLSGVQDDSVALARMGWAMRRLTQGPMPEAGLMEFLGRHDHGHDRPEGSEPLADRVESWLAVMRAARGLHPLTRACLGFHLWPMAALGPEGDRLEAAVTAARIAAEDCRGGAFFVPLASGGSAGLRDGGLPPARLARWLDGIEVAVFSSMRHLDRLESWVIHAGEVTAGLSGRTPRHLIDALVAWPMVSAPMAERLTGSSRAAVQRNLLWFQDHGLIREITGQGRFRFWRAALT
ncbi:MAG: helix-turn-helix domain-containing protein [Paracoccaceae bacterium]